MTFLYVVAIIFLLLPVKLIFPVKRIGNRQNPPKKERLIIACNHLSIRDIFVLGAMFPSRQIHFFAKKELFKKKIPNFLFRKLGAIPVARGEFDFHAVKSAVNILNKDKTLGIYPEGTRNTLSDKDILELKNGVAMFSLKTNSKILPMYQLHKPRLFRRNYVYVGEPFDFSDIDGDKINKERLNRATEKLTARMNDAKQNLYQYANQHNIKINQQKKSTQQDSGEKA